MILGVLMLFLLFVLENTKTLPHVNPAACRFHLYLSFQRFATWIDRSLIINPSLTTGIFPSAFKHLDPCGFGQITELFLYKVLEENLFSTRVWNFMCRKQLLENRIGLLSEPH